MNKVKNILVLQSRIEILVTVPGLGHGVPVCGFHTRPPIAPEASAPTTAIPRSITGKFVSLRTVRCFNGVVLFDGTAREKIDWFPHPIAQYFAYRDRSGIILPVRICTGDVKQLALLIQKKKKKKMATQF